ncbi:MULTISPECIES: COG4223 family protein [unclassified Pannonibacter]|uniref:COG4223 family protein n=1 Tax=unclassified Pannonibacter TaxID=2627228 RepID=UPI00164586D2|nr:MULTISPECIES: mitofilin family membrane protein [unclassified Pannonibacter]
MVSEKDKPGQGAKGSESATGASSSGAAGGSRRPVTIDLVPEKVEAKGEAKAEAAKTESARTESARTGAKSGTTPETPKTDAPETPKAPAKAAGPTPEIRSSTVAVEKPAAEAAAGSANEPAGTGKSGAGKDTSPAKPAAASASSAPQASPAAASQSAAGAAKPSAASTASQNAAGPGASGQGAEQAAASASSSSAAAQAERAPSSSQPRRPAAPSIGFGGALAASLLVSAAVFGACYGLNLAGYLPLRAGLSAEVAEQAALDATRLDTLERRLAELQEAAPAQGQPQGEAPAPAPEALASLDTRLTQSIDALRGDTSSRLADLTSQLDSLRGRMDGMAGGAPAEGGEPAPASSSPAPDAQLMARLDGMQKAIDSLSASLAALQSAATSTEAAIRMVSDAQGRNAGTLTSLSADLTAATEESRRSLDALKAEAGELTQRLAAVEATMGDATAREMAARAVAVSALKTAVDAGKPFETELAALRASLPEGTDIALLESHAAQGIAPQQKLMAEFAPVARAIHATFAKPAEDGSILDSLTSSAASIFTVRGPGDASGQGPEAALRRMENAVSAGDLPAALTAYDELPEAAKAAGADWAASARARVAVDELTEKTSKDVLSSLARKGS